MVQTVKTNAAGVVRPGVFVNQTFVGGLAQPLASHAVGYIFVSTEAEDYLANKYSGLAPYEPTQISSIEDYTRKIGGVPTENKASAISYHAVKSFFDNAGSNSVLYATRVTSTPEVVIDLPSAIGAGYRLFALKINGRYFGSFDMETVDSSGTPIKAILTTGIDHLDNAFDIFEYLSKTDPDFSVFYETERTSQEVTQTKFRIYSRITTVLPQIEEFRAYKLLDSSTPDLHNNAVNILSQYPEAVKGYYPVKNLAIRLAPQGLAIKHINGYDLAEFNSTVYSNSLPDLSDTDLTDADFTALLRAYLAYYEVPIADGQGIAIERDTVNVDPEVKFPDSKAGYSVYAPSGTITFGNSVPSGNLSNREGLLPQSVQVAYVNVAGENRVLISNGSDPSELAYGFAEAIREVFEEKGLDLYYDVEPEVVEYANPSQIFPNNGGSLDNGALASHGYPSFKPSLNSTESAILLSSSTTIGAAGVVTFVSPRVRQPYVGMVVYRDGKRLRVTAVTSSTITVQTMQGLVPEVSSVPHPIFIDKSIANGFATYDYVANIKLTSKNGTIPPLFRGVSRSGLADVNVAVTPSLDELLDFREYKFSKSTKASDYSYAIRQALTTKYFVPGFIFVPEAFATLVSDNDTYTKSLALKDRLKVISAIATVASGNLNDSNYNQATQYVGLIDCGGDIENITQAADELTEIRSIIGAPYGHLAYYAPYILNEQDIFIPPSGYIAGIACSRNVTEGFQQPPAGVRYPLRGAIGLKFPINAQQQEITYALGLNPIRALPNKGIVVWGARTMSSNALFKFINTRVISNVLIDALSRSFDDLLFEQIDSNGAIYSRVISIATTLLNQFYRQGALFGNRPEQAYSIICNDSNNTLELLEQGTVVCDIYVTTSPTLERVLISVARTPAGQVSLINDSFSRNISRFQNATRAQNLIS